jgi:hypothetical protein
MIETRWFLTIVRKVTSFLLVAALAAVLGGLASYLVGSIVEILTLRFVAHLELPGLRAFVLAELGAIVGAIGGIVARASAANRFAAVTCTIFRALVYVQAVVTVVFVPALINYRVTHGKQGSDSTAEQLIMLFCLGLVTVIAGFSGGLVGGRRIRRDPWWLSFLVGIVLVGLIICFVFLLICFG